MKIEFIYLFILIFATSCGSFKGIDIQTKPQKAKVFAYSIQAKKFISIGETPVSITDKKIKELKVSGQDFLAVKVEKSGHIVEHLIYDLKTRKKVNYLIDLKPIELWADKEGTASSRLANEVARKVQMINRFIIKKKLEIALNKTNDLIDLYPKAYMFYDIKGSILLLKGKSDLALLSLKKSLNLNPDNIETSDMVKALEGRERE